MWAFIAVISFIGFLVMLIWGIVSSIRKTGKAKKQFLFSGLFFVLMLAAGIDTDTANQNNQSAQSAPVQSPLNNSEVVPGKVKTNNDKQAASKETAEAVVPKAEENTAEETKEETPAKAEEKNAEEDKPKETISQRNAIAAAKLYLSTAPFSRKGLIEQLEFEGYPTEDAEYAVDSLNVDWNEQAVRSAELYLSVMPFSKKELIEQLVFEGFTREQAEYGVNKVYQ